MALDSNPISNFIDEYVLRTLSVEQMYFGIILILVLFVLKKWIFSIITWAVLMVIDRSFRVKHLQRQLAKAERGISLSLQDRQEIVDLIKTLNLKKRIDDERLEKINPPINKKGEEIPISEIQSNISEYMTSKYGDWDLNAQSKWYHANLFEILSKDIVEEYMYDTESGLGDHRAQLLGLGDNNEEGVDSYIWEPNPDHRNYGLTLIQSKWRVSDPKSNKAKKENEDPLVHLKEAAEMIYDRKISVGNKEFQKMNDSYWQAWDETGNQPPIGLVLVSQGANSSADHRNKIARYNATYIDMNEVYGFIRRPLDIKINVSPRWVVAALQRSKHKVEWIGSMSAYEICLNIFSKPGASMQRDLDVLDMNVRLRLSNKGRDDIDEDSSDHADTILLGTRKTIDETPEKFFRFNNGIVITCKKIYSPFSKWTSSYKLDTPQVVNGGQTINALYDYYDGKIANDHELLKKIQVPVKLIDCSNVDDYVAESANVAKAANSQNPVQARDLKANDPLMRNMQNDFAHKIGRSIWYDIRAGEYETRRLHDQLIVDHRPVNVGKQTPRILENTDHGRYIWAARGGGYAASTAKRKLFTTYYDALFGSDEELPPSATYIAKEQEFYFPSLSENEHRETIREALFLKLQYQIFRGICTKNKGGIARVNRSIIASEITENKGNVRIEALRLLGSFPYIGITLLNCALKIRVRQALSLSKVKPEDIQWKVHRGKIIDHIIGDINNEFADGGQGLPFAFKFPFQTHNSVWDNSGMVATDDNWMEMVSIEIGEATGGNGLRELAGWCVYITNIAVKTFYGLLNDKTSNFAVKRDATESMAEDFIQQCLSEIEIDKKLCYLPLTDSLKTKELKEFEDTIPHLSKPEILKQDALKKLIEIRDNWPPGIYYSEEQKLDILRSDNIYHLSVLKHRIAEKETQLASTSAKGKKRKLEDVITKMQGEAEELEAGAKEFLNLKKELIEKAAIPKNEEE